MRDRICETMYYGKYSGIYVGYRGSILQCLWDFKKNNSEYFFVYFSHIFRYSNGAQGVPIVCCWYCGKVIGAFRLLRDSEFCSALHRRKYGERLGKALHEIAAPEPAPAGVAGFLDQMPFQQGNLSRTLNPWQTVTGQHRIRNGAHWPLTIDTSDPTRDATRDATSDTTSDATSDATSDPTRVPVPIAAHPPVEIPPWSESWMSAPVAEPVAGLVQASATLAPARTQRAPRLAALLEATPVLDQVRHALDPCHN